MNTRTLGLKVLGSMLALTALSTLSGCYVVTRPMPARGVYVEPGRAVYVEPARPVYVEPYRGGYYRRY